MTIRPLAATLALVLLAGCEFDPAQLEADSLAIEFRRAYDATYEEMPFEKGAVSVIATENGKLRTYLLAPCQGEGKICAGGPQGRAGTLTIQPYHQVVTGAYRDRAFYLAPGGRGWLVTRGQRIPLAWK
jgi:hypothetical protein